MNAHAIQKPIARELTLAALFGLAAGRGPVNGERMRGLQYARLAEVAWQRLCVQAIAAGLMLVLAGQAVAPVEAVVWLSLLAASLYSAFRIDVGLANGANRRLAPARIQRHFAVTVVNGLIWAVPAFFGLSRLPAMVGVELAAVLAMLLTFMTVVLSSVLLSSVILCLIVGVAAIAGFFVAGDQSLALIAALFVVSIVVGAIEVARHVLESRLALEGLAERGEVVSLLLREHDEGEADWLWQVDSRGLVRSVSRRFSFALGKEPTEIEGESFLKLIAGSGWPEGHCHSTLYTLAHRLKQRESFSNLPVRVTVKGQPRWWELSGAPRLNERGLFDGFRGVASDITRQRETSEKIAYLARYDTLTGLPNRMMVTSALGEALADAAGRDGVCAFLMIDLDRFKSVNDTLGHLIGDKLLAQVAGRLNSLMSANELCGRLGGDEFAIVMRDASQPNGVDRLAHAVIERLSEPYNVDSHTLYVGASVGSALGPRDGPNVEELMRNADLALYRAKEGGRLRHFPYEPGLHAQAEERRRLEMSLRQALERGEFLLHFQPVVDAGDERVVSFEALLRWQSPEAGLISPANFVPLAEETRLIVPIGEWVLRTACEEAASWPAPVKVAVNVSGVQLLDPGFVDSVVSALAGSGLPPQRLELEVTESIFLRDAGTARSVLEEVMALGCKVSLDDFGTGYSALGYLRKLRFTTIKVDRSFVVGAASENPESLAIIRAVVALAQSLEMETTAEGVETESQLALVRRLGCTKVQGFHFGRPMTSEQIMQIFSREARRRGAA